MPISNPNEITARRPGMLQVYAGEASLNQGWLADFDGKWIYLSTDTFRTIGNETSGASIAQAWTWTLFEFLWSEYPNSICPVLTAAGQSVNRGASALADYQANRRITLPDCRGRVVVTAGTGQNLTLRERGDAIGAETHTLTIAEMPSHSHATPYAGGTSITGTTVLAPATSRSNTAPGPSTNAAGSGAGHNNMQPSIVQHLLISAGVR